MNIDAATEKKYTTADIKRLAIEAAELGWHHKGSYEKLLLKTKDLLSTLTPTPPTTPDAAPVQPSEAIPSGVYFVLDEDNFYSSITQHGMGTEFFKKWKNRWSEFPSTATPVQPGEPHASSVEEESWEYYFCPRCRLLQKWNDEGCVDNRCGFACEGMPTLYRIFPVNPSDDQISADLAAAGIDMTEPNRKLRAMIGKHKAEAPVIGDRAFRLTMALEGAFDIGREHPLDIVAAVIRRWLRDDAEAVQPGELAMRIGEDIKNMLWNCHEVDIGCNPHEYAVIIEPHLTALVAERDAVQTQGDDLKLLRDKIAEFHRIAFDHNATPHDRVDPIQKQFNYPPPTQAEPVAWMVVNAGRKFICDNRDDVKHWASNFEQIQPLYIHPPASDLAKLTAERDAARKASDIFEEGSKENSEVFQVLYGAGLIPNEKPGPSLAKVVNDLLVERDAARDELKSANNLLAVIHRDGGHHTDAVEFKQSCEDAAGVYHELKRHADLVGKIRELVDGFPEINMGNYNDDDVSYLNNWGIEVVKLLDAAPSPDATKVEAGQPADAAGVSNEP